MLILWSALLPKRAADPSLSMYAKIVYMWRSLLNLRSNSTWKRPGGRRVLGVCCILLVVLGATAELTHAHSSGTIHPDCSLCVVAHSAAQVTVYSPAPVVLRPVAECADPEPIFVRRSLDIRLSIRPPPVAPAFA